MIVTDVILFILIGKKVLISYSHRTMLLYVPRRIQLCIPTLSIIPLMIVALLC